MPNQAKTFHRGDVILFMVKGMTDPNQPKPLKMEPVIEGTERPRDDNYPSTPNLVRGQQTRGNFSSLTASLPQPTSQISPHISSPSCLF